MMHRAWSSIVEVPYSFSRSYVKCQGHTALKIVEFDPNRALPDSNSSLNSSMAMKCCTKLETAKKRCPIVFQGHPSNFKVTRDKTSPILTQIGRFRTIGRSQLSNPSDLPCWIIFVFHISLICYDFSGELFISICKKKEKEKQVCKFHYLFMVARSCILFMRNQGESVDRFICVIFNESEEISYLHVYKEEYITNQTFAARKPFWAP